MTNLLASESSLYLQQHAENPVNWYPWGEEAMRLAEEQNKPLLVSIGYSSCHWCHVMAHESFEDEYIANLMNKHFVCVKVDREERPDVDQVYMEAVQMIQQQGGWPLNVFCLPDGRPFFGGTYFPPEDIGNGLIPWPQLLMRIADYYKRSRSELLENAESIQKNILAANQIGGSGTSWQPEILIDGAKGIIGNHDDEFGGFGDAPKFPPSMSLNFLRAIRASSIVEKDRELSSRIDDVCHATLRAMAHGGIFDQFGGGFSRYSVDRHWLIPHFEKMLYDNALLIDAYTRGWLAGKSPLYAAVVEETIGWLDREMTSPRGGFYAAIDADSEGEEGRYYVWTPKQVDEVLGPSAARQIRDAYNITADGNFENGTTNPALVEPDFSVRQTLAEARDQLLAHREAERVPPGKDEKMSTFWNALMIRALADTGFYFGRRDWMAKAIRAAEFLWTELCEESDESLAINAVFYEGAGPQVDGFLHDYATLADAFLTIASKVDWMEAGQSKIWIYRAKRCVDAALEKFGDPQSAGFYFTAAGVETTVARRKEWFDNATPSGNSVLLQALSGLYALTGDSRYAKELQRALPAYVDYATRVASGVAHGLEAAASEAIGVAVVKVSAGGDFDAVRDVIVEKPWRRCFVMFAEDEISASYQLCVGTQCLTPSNDLVSIVEGL